MSGYRIEWDCCGDETYTQAWIPEECPFCESHRLQRELTAAKAENEALRGRVAELEWACQRYIDVGIETYIEDAMDSLDCNPFILRRQADAVEFAASEARTHLIECAWPQSGLPDEASLTLDEVEGRAGRLRDEADRVESGGGDE